MSGPLTGIRVVDLTTVVMGPFATQILADFGADVIKVEAPEGDVIRHVAPMRHPGMGHIFLHHNRGKRSIVLDLKKTAGRTALLRLAATADVLIYNLRPQAMARLQLTYEDVRAVNPRIIYVGTYGFSQDGPYAAHPAYDDLIQGMVALPSILVDAGAQRPRFVPTAIADRITGLSAVNAITAALYFRERSGEGQAIEVPMFETLTQMVLSDHMGGRTFEPPEGPSGYGRMLAPHRAPYSTKDGYVCVLVYNDKQWRAFFRLKRTTAEWLRLLRDADIPVTPMNTVDDLIDDAHLAKTGFFSTIDHPSEGKLRAMAVPSQWSASPPAVSRPAPRLGEHSIEVLREAGYTDAEIDVMIAAGVTVATSD
jgi:crotonobetainyl-CoA:carnitine CoA-transferase CaiB-like acyl-CoA transferase